MDREWAWSFGVLFVRSVRLNFTRDEAKSPVAAGEFSLVAQHFDAAALEVTALNAVGDECERFVIRGQSFRMTLETAEQIGARRVIEVVVVEFAVCAELIDECEAAVEAFAHGYSDGVIEQHNGRGCNASKPAVEQSDLRPIGICCTCGFAMNSGDGSLQLIGSGQT